ncbi:MAG: hypothetical protein ACRENW_02260 [Thermodesulfobacteriota bacterium]
MPIRRAAAWARRSRIRAIAGSLCRNSSVEKYQRWAEQYQRAYAGSGTVEMQPDCLDSIRESAAQ